MSGVGNTTILPLGLKHTWLS